MHTIKLHRPTGTVIADTLSRQLPPKPGDIVIVFDPTSTFIGNITILLAIDSDNPIGKQFEAPVTIFHNDNPIGMRFVAPTNPSDEHIYYWAYAYKVPEGYASVETTND